MELFRTASGTPHSTPLHPAPTLRADVEARTGRKAESMNEEVDDLWHSLGK